MYVSWIPSKNNPIRIVGTGLEKSEDHGTTRTGILCVCLLRVQMIWNFELAFPSLRWVLGGYVQVLHNFLFPFQNAVAYPTDPSGPCLDAECTSLSESTEFSKTIRSSILVPWSSVSLPDFDHYYELVATCCINFQKSFTCSESYDSKWPMLKLDSFVFFFCFFFSFLFSSRNIGVPRQWKRQAVLTKCKQKKTWTATEDLR
jgi:hypothetical protein